ncbi:MAG: DUF2442 domain-containing protein, partial [Phormidesmis sp.]
HILIVHFSNQEIRQYSIRPLLKNPMFAPLRRPAFFKNFKIEPGGYALVWNEEIDISEYELWKNGTAVTDEPDKTHQLLESYAKEADYAKVDHILARVPDVPPIEGDEL